jgi:hypothetical protein
MKARKWFGLFFIAIGFVVACCLHPAVYWKIRIWNAQSSLYDGKPAQYWAEEIVRYDTAFESARNGTLRPRSIVRQTTDDLGFTRRVDVKAPPAVLGRDPAALPVLLDLLGDSNETVRRRTASALLQSPHSPDIAVPILIARLENDKVADVRILIIRILGCYGRLAAPATSSLNARLKQLLDTDSPTESTAVEECEAIRVSLSKIIEE